MNYVGLKDKWGCILVIKPTRHEWHNQPNVENLVGWGFGQKSKTVICKCAVG